MTTTPLEELTEAMARAFVREAGAVITADDDNWPHTVSSHRKMCAEYLGYGDARSLVHDAFRNARTALSALDALGLVIAPGEATDLMFERGRRHMMFGTAGDVYAAMLAASPYKRT